jgi:hypothetical protein
MIWTGTLPVGVKRIGARHRELFASLADSIVLAGDKHTIGKKDVRG